MSPSLQWWFSSQILNHWSVLLGDLSQVIIYSKGTYLWPPNAFLGNTALSLYPFHLNAFIKGSFAHNATFLILCLKWPGRKLTHFISYSSSEWALFPASRPPPCFATCCVLLCFSAYVLALVWNPFGSLKSWVLQGPSQYLTLLIVSYHLDLLHFHLVVCAVLSVAVSGRLGLESLC